MAQKRSRRIHFDNVSVRRAAEKNADHPPGGMAGAVLNCRAHMRGRPFLCPLGASITRAVVTLVITARRRSLPLAHALAVIRGTAQKGTTGGTDGATDRGSLKSASRLVADEGSRTCAKKSAANRAGFGVRRRFRRAGSKAE